MSEPSSKPTSRSRRWFVILTMGIFFGLAASQLVDSDQMSTLVYVGVGAGLTVAVAMGIFLRRSG